MRTKGLAAVLLILAFAASLSGRARKNTYYERQFHARVPLGAEKIELRPSGELYLLATAESPVFDGWRVRRYDEQKRVLLTRAGEPVRHFPTHLRFRVTATAMRPKLLETDTYATLSLPEYRINSYLLGVRFRVLIFHDLEVTRVEPDSVQLIGMPAAVAYNERIYELSFTMPRRVPVQDHIVLEVLTPGGSRMCKFPLEFF